MQIQINTGESVEGREALFKHTEAVVKDALGRFSDHVTRVEIHLSDVNGQKAGDRDKRVMMEARIAGRQPLAVSDEAGSLHHRRRLAEAQALARRGLGQAGRQAPHPGPASARRCRPARGRPGLSFSPVPAPLPGPAGG